MSQNSLQIKWLVRIHEGSRIFNIELVGFRVGTNIDSVCTGTHDFQKIHPRTQPGNL